MVREEETTFPGPVRALAVDADRELSFDALVAKYERPIYNLIYRHLGDPEEAADLTQDTFVAAYQAYGRFRGEAKVFTWLCQIALNRVKNRFKQRDRRRAHEGPSLDEPRADEENQMLRELATRGLTPEQTAQNRELGRQIDTAIRALPEEYRTVIILCDLQGLPYRTIAEITGLSLEAVKTRIHRGRQALRRRLSAYLNP
jgi:RNA polymerase sigma-70 factor, ECF subfamily